MKPRKRKPAAKQNPLSSAAAAKRKAALDLGMPSCSATVWTRVARLHGLLNQQRKFTSVSLADEMELDERTMQRTVAFMRDGLGLPIAWVHAAHSYRYTEPCPFLPLIRITADEAFVLNLAKETLAAWAGLGVCDRFNTTLKKFAVVVGGTLSFSSTSLTEVLFPKTILGAAERRHIAAVNEAVVKCRELRVAYRKAGAEVAETRLIHPLDLAHRNGRWLLLLKSVERGEYRTFILGRIQSLEPTGVIFRRPADFNAAEMLRGNLDAYTGHEDHMIRIALTGPAAVDAIEQAWHGSQTHLKLPDGRTEITLRLNNLVDVEHEILHWGPFAEALSPPELRKKVRASLEAALKFYPGTAA